MPTIKSLVNLAYDEGMIHKILGLNAIIELKRVFKTEVSRFILAVGLKVSGISFIITFFVHYSLFQIMRLNYAFFKAHGFPEFSDGTPFYDLLIAEVIENIPVLFIFHIILFFAGCYLGWLMLRPFRSLSDYCEKVIENPNLEYKVEDFSAYRLLTRFSEFFFEYLRESRRKGELLSNSIPPQYSKIHRPVFDKVFMLHFGLLLIIIAICSATFIVQNSGYVLQNLVSLAANTLSDYKTINKFFDNQIFIFNELVILTIVLVTISYIMLAFHLYSKVSGAAFGIFSTMRSFMKGNYFSRVHLVGHGYLRDYTRKLNKYLDYINNNFNKGHPKG